MMARRPAATLLALCLLLSPGLARTGSAPPLPATLAATGYAELAKLEVEPQYPLWSDGAKKRRWLHIPPGTAIDAADPDRWEFPPGTRAWKEFGHGRAVETRFIERLADGSWRYATYLWNADGSEATLAPEDGADLRVQGAPGGRYAVPSRNDCVACHEGPAVPLLGVSALQLSGSLADLAARGWLRKLPSTMLERPPRIAAPDDTARAALGYLHGNCGHCHNDGALSGVELVLWHGTAHPAQSARRVLDSLLERSSRYRPQGAADVRRVVPGDAASSVIPLRMKSRNPMARMPPIGVQIPDAEGLALIERWIDHLQPPENPK